MNKRLSLATLISFSLVLLFAGILALPMKAGATTTWTPPCANPFDGSAKISITVISKDTSRIHNYKILSTTKTSDGYSLGTDSSKPEISGSVSSKSPQSHSFTVNKTNCIAEFRTSFQITNEVGLRTASFGNSYQVPDIATQSITSCLLTVTILNLSTLSSALQCLHTESTAEEEEQYILQKDAQTLQSISNILKSQDDTEKNVIDNTR